MKSFRRLLSYGHGYERLTIAGAILAGLSAILCLLPYFYIWKIIDMAIMGGSEMDTTGMIRCAVIAVALSAAYAAVYFTALMMTHVGAFHIAGNMRIAGVERLLRLPLGFYTGRESGALRKLVDDNAESTEMLLAHSTPDTVASLVTPIFALFMLFRFDWRMGIAVLVSLALSLVTMGYMMSGSNAGFYHRYVEANERIAGEAVEYVRGIPVVKTFQQTVYSFRAFNEAIRDCSEKAYDYAMAQRLSETLFLTFINGAFVLLLPLGVFLCSVPGNGWKALSDLVFYSMFAPACGDMVNRLMYASQAFMDANEAVRRLDQLMGQPEQPDTGKKTAPEQAGVTFEHVGFHYPETDRQILKDLNLTARPGQITALVGPSGGGKTTTAFLIPRFYDVDQGRVAFRERETADVDDAAITVSEGISTRSEQGSANAAKIRTGSHADLDVREVPMSQLMQRVSFVLQNAGLFNVSVRENLTMAKPDAADEELWQALESASCADVVRGLPDGLDTVVGSQGLHVSGGELQRIALARVFLKDSPIIILDEATAYADPDNEYVIQQAISRLAKGRTVIMIAHRLSTVRNADQILVMENGQIREHGRHDDLVAQGGLYAQMWHDYTEAADWRIGFSAQK